LFSGSCGSCEHRGGSPPLALFSRGNSLHGNDSAVHGNGIGASVLIVARTAGTSTVQRKPLEQVRHTSGWRSGDDVASSGASSLDSFATRLGCQRERVASQNGFNVVHHPSSQAVRQGCSVSQGEHDGLADLEAVSWPRHHAGVGNADSNQGLRRTGGATLHAEGIRTAVVFNCLAE